MLAPTEVVEIEAIFATYFHIIPRRIHTLWVDAKRKGPTIVGPSETESDNMFLPFDLEEMLEEIAKEIRKRGRT